MYQLCQLGLDGQQFEVKRISDNLFIPFNTANTDYQAYLKFLAEGGVPLPADEPASEA